MPLTRTNGFGVFNVIGTSRDPKPAARKIALFTRYGLNASIPFLVIRLSLVIKDFSNRLEIVLLTVPKERLVSLEINL